MYKEGKYLGCLYKVNEDGDCFTQNSEFKWIHREWRYNSDGYPVVSATGRNNIGERIYRTIQVHILVAREFVKGWFEGAEVNHKDFNRSNPAHWNLEWVSHKDNIAHSCRAGRYAGKFGEDNPNYRNTTLHERYAMNKKLSKEKQSRPRGRNGKAKKCILYNDEAKIEFRCDCQRDAVDLLIDHDIVDVDANKEYIIKLLKRPMGIKNWHISIIK